MYPRLWYYKEVFNGTLTETGYSEAFDSNTLKDKSPYKPYEGLKDVNLRAEKAGVILTITDVSGTMPYLDTDIEGSEDGINWATLATGVLPSLTSAGTYANGNFGIYPVRYLRLKFTLGGTTPSFTFTAGIKVMV